LLQEDRFFYWPPGVNPVALLRAALRTWRGTARAGGATLSMQLARWLYDLDTGTVRGKLLQIVRAVQLEACYSKHDLLEPVLHDYVRGHADSGIHNAAALLVDHRDRAVRAMVGSADFKAAAICGQINRTLAKRSATSMLQPFVGALLSDAAPSIAEPLLASGTRMSMAQLATLYATLANRGEMAPLRYVRDAPLPPLVRLLSQDATAAIVASLRDIADTRQSFASAARRIRGHMAHRQLTGRARQLGCGCVRAVRAGGVGRRLQRQGRSGIRSHAQRPCSSALRVH
jgi:membrane carboxypeptidase/penicillin-binding protein PbpC